MSHIWTFSPESKLLLERCLNAAAPPDKSNKWLQRFGPKNLDLINKTADTIIVNDSPDIDDGPALQENQDDELSQAVEEYLDPNLDIISKIDEIVEKCKTSPKILTKLAQTLPKITVEKLFTHILNTSLNNDLLELFYVHFLHSFMKRDNSRICTDILLSMQRNYPKYLKLALELILKDLEIENNVVNDFILNLNSDDQMEFLNILSHIELNSQEFAHNLFNIYTAYKSCEKTDSVQNYILSCLNTHCNYCSNDKNYGKLLLAFLQHENSLHRNIVSGTIENIIETHKSPFKRPCVSVFNLIKEYKYFWDFIF